MVFAIEGKRIILNNLLKIKLIKCEILPMFVC